MVASAQSLLSNMVTFTCSRDENLNVIIQFTSLRSAESNAAFLDESTFLQLLIFSVLFNLPIILLILIIYISAQRQFLKDISVCNLKIFLLPFHCLVFYYFLHSPYHSDILLYFNYLSASITIRTVSSFFSLTVLART